MWISRQLAQEKQETPPIQTAKVTLNNTGEDNGVSAGSERGVKLCSPYGYCFSLPAGESLILTHCDAQQTAIGVTMAAKGLKTGEIKISSESGGYIYLKNDGSVIINGLEINSDGVIVSDR